MVDLTPQPPLDAARDLREMIASPGFRLFAERVGMAAAQVDDKLRRADEPREVYRLQGERRGYATVLGLAESMLTEAQRKRQEGR